MMDVLVFKQLENENLAWTFAIEHRLIPGTNVCSENILHPEFINTGKAFGYYFRCTKNIVEKKFLFEKTVFERNKLKIGQCFCLIYYFVKNEVFYESLKRKLKLENNEIICRWLSIVGKFVVFDFTTILLF
jgi:hypothetical protein